MKTVGGSLARRVLIGSILLLGLPLFVHTFFLYHREYRENIDDAFSILNIISENRKLYIEQKIGCQQNILSGLLDNLPEDPEERSAFLQKESKEYHMDEFLVVEEPQDERMKRDSFVFLDQEKQRLVVGRALTPHSVFLITTPASELLIPIDTYYPVAVSLIDENGTIFMTTESGLKDERYAVSHEHFTWTEQGKFKNAWFLETDQEEFLVISAPIRGTNYFLMVDVPEKSIADIQIKDYLIRIVFFLAVFCFVGGGALVWLTRRFSKPLESLRTVMQRVSEGAVHVRYSSDRIGFEINTIGNQLNQMLDALLSSREEAEKERIVRERLAEELRIGHQIQKSILPTNFSQVPFLEIVPGYRAALEVSGDFYDLFVLEDGKILLSIGDAAGKGISACLFSLSFRSMLRSAATGRNDLASIVKTANDLFLQDAEQSSFFISAWIGLYDPESRELAYCSQGHPPALLVSNEAIEPLGTMGISLGVEIIDPEIKRITLQAGDLLLLYTDGIIEAHNRERELFGMERLKKFLLKSKGSSEKKAKQLLEEIQKFCEGAAQNDDETFLVLKIK